MYFWFIKCLYLFSEASDQLDLKPDLKQIRQFREFEHTQTRSSDSFPISVLKRPEQALWVEVARHDGMQNSVWSGNSKFHPDCEI